MRSLTDALLKKKQFYFRLYINIYTFFLFRVRHITEWKDKLDQCLRLSSCIDWHQELTLSVRSSINQGFGSAFFLRIRIRIRIRSKIFMRIRIRFRIRILGVSGGEGWG